MKLFEALAGGAFNHLTINIREKLTKISQIPRSMPRGGPGAWPVLELTGTFALKPWIYKMGWIKDVQFMQKSFDMTYQESDCMTIPQQ